MSENKKLKNESIDWKGVEKHHEMYTRGSGKGPYGYPSPQRMYECLLDLNRRLEKVEELLDRFAGGKEWRQKNLVNNEMGGQTSDDLWKCPKCGNHLVQLWNKLDDDSGTTGDQYVRCYQCGFTRDV